jgi:NAD(P)-dependent dehydrogenase (short-subunit alcohol dehydrogenase family)
LYPRSVETEIPAKLWQDEVIQTKWLEEIPAEQLGITDDIVSCALFLCTNEAAYLTGKLVMTATR